MNKLALSIVICITLLGCNSGNNPFEQNAEGTSTETSENENPQTSEDTEKTQSVTILEGDANEYRYDKDSDTLHIVGLPFDGTKNEPYLRQIKLFETADYEQFDVYEEIDFVYDPIAEQNIKQINSNAIRAVSETGKISAIVVRQTEFDSGGFGGYILQRHEVDNNGNPVFYEPDKNGQIYMSGKYMGIRSFDNTKGGSYVTADMQTDIDIDDSAIRLTLSNRERFNLITGDSLEGEPLYTIPLHGFTFVVSYEDMIENNGEFSLIQESSLQVDGMELGKETIEYRGVFASNQDGISEAGGVITISSLNPDTAAEALNTDEGNNDEQTSIFLNVSEYGVFLTQRK